MKMAILHPSLNHKRGAENLVVWMSGGLAARGHEVTLFTEEFVRELWSERETENFAIHLLSRGGVSKLTRSKRIAVYKQARGLSKLLEPFDVIIPSVPPSHIWVTQAKKLNPRIRARILWYFEGPLRRFYWNVTERHLLNHRLYYSDPKFNLHLCRDIEHHEMRDEKRKRQREHAWDREADTRIDHILAYSSFSAENFAKVFKTPVSVCHPGIPVADVEKVEARRAGDYLLAVSPLWAKKNVHNIIEALSLLSSSPDRRSIKLKIVGNGPCLSDLKALAENRRLDSQVEFRGYLCDKELADTYRGARMSAYVPIDEPFGLIAVESMNQGVPPIVSDHGGLSEIVVHGESGLLVNPFDPNEIAGAIKLLWDDEEKKRQMGLAAKRRVDEYFTLERFLDRFETLLSQQPEREMIRER